MSIPSVDLAHFTHGDSTIKHRFVKSLGKAFEEVGFVAVKNHGLTDTDSNRLYDAFKRFFELPDDLKMAYDIPGMAGQRGYTGKRKENAKGNPKPDLKEFYHVGQENKPKEADLMSAYPDNIWPAEVPELKSIALHVFKTLEKAGIQLLQAIALYLHLPEQFFDKQVDTGNSILRAIHYFPLDKENIEPGSVRAGAHEDINLITLLMGASTEGLEILNKNNQWVSVKALHNQIVVNVGDMLSRLTNDKLVSTTHRVVNPPSHQLHLPRYSMPFFMHPRADMDLSCLASCISDINPKKYNDITAGDFLNQRLREIGLLK